MFYLICVLSPSSFLLQVPNTEEQWKEIQRLFEVKWNFPQCCGAIDGKHIQIKRPPNSVSDFYNYKGTYSVILLALVDYDYKFLYIDVGTNGRANDGSVFKVSTLNAAMTKNLLNFPKHFLIVGDDAFPLRENLLKPFSRKNLTREERIFNYRLSRARRVSENAFGILASRFRIFGKPIEVQLATADLVVKCACTIHNWLRITSTTNYCPKGCFDCEDTDSGVVIPGTWRSESTELPSIGKPRTGRKNTKEASERRNRFMNHFVGAGSVPWQVQAVGLEE